MTFVYLAQTWEMLCFLEIMYCISINFDVYQGVVEERCVLFNQPSIYIDGWLYAMSMTSVVCNVPVMS